MQSGLCTHCEYIIYHIHEIAYARRLNSLAPIISSNEGKEESEQGNDNECGNGVFQSSA